MPEGQPSHESAATEPAATEPAPPPSQPEPPPYMPDEELIGYIERGQTPPAEERQR
jgi:hypothetical protein